MATRVLPGTIYDVSILCAIMRHSDVVELELMHRATGMRPLWLFRNELTAYVTEKKAWSLWDGDDLLGMGGVTEIEGHEHVRAAWFMGTVHADRKPLALTRACRRFLSAHEGQGYRIGNVIPFNMLRTGRKKWLENLGFDFEKPKAHENGQNVAVFWLRSATAH